MPVLAILLGCGLTLAVACALGRWLLIRCQAWELLSRGERGVFSLGMGAALLSNVVFLLCAAQLAYWPVFLGVGAALTVAGWWRRAPGAPVTLEAGGPSAWLAAPVLLCYGYLYLANALAPEISPDGAGYHLGLVSRYLRERGFSHITTHLYAMLSQGMEMLYLYAFALGRHSAAKLLHFALLAATVAAMISFGRRFQVLPAAATAAVFYFCSPVVGADGASTYNDCALAFFLFLTFYLLLIWDQTRSPALWAPIGVAAGFCFSIKYTGFLALPFALGFLAWKLRREWLGPAAAVTAAASLFVIPWLVKNAIISGNPVAPFFNQLFPNPYFHVSFERIYLFFMRHYGGLAEHDWREYLRLPWEVAVAGGALQGLVGPLFLLAPAGLAALRRPLGRLIWLAAVIFALPWLSNIGTRFLIPSLVFVSLSMAMAIWETPRRAALPLAILVAGGHAVGSWPSVIARWNHRQPWRLHDAPWRAALRREPEAEYLARTLPGYNVAKMIEQQVPAGKRVFAPEGVSEAYCEREVVVSYQCAECELLMDHLLTPVVHDFAPQWIFRWEWPEQELAALRLIQTRADPVEMWSLHELLLFAGAERRTPLPAWKIRARPNPWDGALAMDGSPATRWRSWQSLEPGMRFQVDFPALRLSALEAQCSSDQQQMAMELEIRGPGGDWKRLPAPVKQTDPQPPREAMKRLAAGELRRHGIDYLLTDLGGQGMNLIGPHIAQDPGAWGLEEVGRYGPFRLYAVVQ